MNPEHTDPPSVSAQSLRDIVTDPGRCAGDPQLRLDAWRQLMSSRGKATNHLRLVQMQRDAGLYGRLAQFQTRAIR